MKRALFLLTLLSSSMIAHTQISRSVHSTIHESVNRTCVLTEINGNMLFVTVKESTEDTLRITLAWMDEFGETSGYQHAVIPGVIGKNHSLSGVGVNAASELTLAVIVPLFGTMTLQYYKMNPANGAVSFDSQNSLSLKSGFIRTRQNGDSLITYACTSAETFRIAANVNSTMNSTTDLMSSGLSYGGSITAGKKSVGLIIDDNDIEIVTIGTEMVRRENQVYTSVNTGLSPAALNGAATGTNDQGDILVVSGINYVLYDNSLNLISDGTFPVGISIGKFLEVYSINSNWILYADASGSGLSRKYVFDTSMNLLSNYPIGESKLKPFDLIERGNGKVFVVGSKLERKNLDDLYSLFVIEDDGVNPQQTFIEYDQTIDHYEQLIHTGHVNSSFMTPMQTPGLQLNHNGVDKMLIYKASNVVVGEDASGGHRGLWGGYGSSNVFPGPFTPEVNKSHESIDRYNRGYYVDKSMIDQHLWDVTNTAGYDPPFGIKYWPAHGDLAMGQAQNLAPFHDQNSNGIYEPLLGDYPLIYGDRCVLNLFYQNESNDVILTAFDNTDLECFQYIYVFDCDTSEALQNTVFMTQKFVFYGQSVTNAYAGVWMDSDVGNPFDDYGGTNVRLGMVYGYNGDLVDESIMGYPGFNDTLAAVGMMILKGTPLSDDGIDNAIGIGLNETVNGFGFGDGIIDNEHWGLESTSSWANSTFYSTGQEYYNFIQGKMLSGAYPQANGVDVRYHYFGTSDPQMYASWGNNHGNDHYEFNIPNAPSDRHITGATAPVNIDPADPTKNSIEMTTAFITSLDTTASSTALTDPLHHLFSMGEYLKSMYGQNAGSCATSFDPYISSSIVGINELELKASIFPNPSASAVQIRVNNTQNFDVRIVDINGREVFFETQFSNGEQVNVSNWESGIYLIQISTLEGTANKKFFKK